MSPKVDKTLTPAEQAALIGSASRRIFLSRIGTTAGAVMLASCGGGGSDALGSTSLQVPAPAPPVPLPPSPVPAPPPPAPVLPQAGARAFSLLAPSTGVHPFAIGFAFRQGDLPSGQQAVANVAALQLNVLTRWPDGSAKWAVVAGRAALSAATPATVVLTSAPTAAAGPTLTTADLRATGITASIRAGAFGAADWQGADWDRPDRAWVTGPEMSSWLYQKPVGTDAHLVGWLEVRLFADGNVEVLPWVENGYLKVAAPTNKSATYDFTLGGTQRFSAPIDLPNRCRTPLLSGTRLAHWLKGDPELVVRHDSAYLQSTELVPTYFAQTPADAPVVASLPATFTPLQQGSFPVGMGAAGYHGSIGLLPEWDVLYLTCTTSSAPWAALQRNAYSAGRYGIHFRDEATRQPLRFLDHPTLCMGGGNGVSGTGASTTSNYTARGTGTAPAAYASSHQPAMGYLAALVTGRHFHLQTVQFQATANFLKNGDVSRQRSAGVFLSNAGANTTRGAAWAWRTLAQALCLTPESDPLHSELRASMSANIDYYHARYVARPNNPQGWITPYSDYTGTGDNSYFEATWMQDFFTASVGYSRALRLPLPDSARSRLVEFFAWKANSVVGRLGGAGAGEFLYRDAAPYTVSVAPSDAPDFAAGTGPWHKGWAEVYAATYRTSPGEPSPGPLRGGNFPDPTSYWGNLQPALAYAVRFAVPGAMAGMARMTGSSNWGQFVERSNASPVWSVRAGSGA